METKSAWNNYDDAALEELEQIAAGYIDFISENKIEREFARAAVELAEKAGTVPDEITVGFGQRLARVYR